MAEYDDTPTPQPPTPACDPKLAPFKASMSDGLTVTDSTGQISVRIEDAHAPPVKNFNDWTVVVLDANGRPNPNAKLNWACAWMAVHTHGSNPQSITNLGGGRFVLGKQNLSMYGPWQVRLWVDPIGAGPEYTPQTGANVANGNECTPTNGSKPSQNIAFDICVPDNGGMQ